MSDKSSEEPEDNIGHTPLACFTEKGKLATGPVDFGSSRSLRSATGFVVVGAADEFYGSWPRVE